jgi:hypothetical protein
LISDGDLRINGNLIVNGTTTTKDTETSLIKDNFIILNSEGEALGTQLSGISIRTNSKDAYGIAYDITNDSVSLGQGVISNDGNFSFNQGESKPILTRDVSANLQDGHLLVWDAEKNIAVDGGAYDLNAIKQDFATWDAHNALVREVRNNDDDILALQNKDSEIDSTITQIQIKDQEQCLTEHRPPGRKRVCGNRPQRAGCRNPYCKEAGRKYLRSRCSGR